MDDDFNTGAALGHLFALAGMAKKADKAASEDLLRSVRDLGRLLGLFLVGDSTLVNQGQSDGDDQLSNGLMELVLDLRQKVRANRDFETAADHIRDSLKALGISVKDSPDGSTWSRE